MDIRLFIESIYEFEKLKMVVLKEKQLEIFDKLPKPEVVVFDDQTKQTIRNYDMHFSLLNRKLEQEKGARRHLSFLVDSAASKLYNKGRPFFNQNE